jgi:alanine racemase
MIEQFFFLKKRCLIFTFFIFFCIDVIESKVTDQQISNFKPIVSQIKKNFKEIDLTIHASNSAATLTRGNCDLDMHRVGISLCKQR